jgi:hypothetical protein
MARGGRRPGAGRKPTGPGPETRIQIPVRVRPAIKQQLDELSRYNETSLTKQAELLLVQALKRPEWIDEDDLRGWRGKHQFAFGRLCAHAAGRVEAVLALTSAPAQNSPNATPGSRTDRTWSADAFATRTLRMLINRILEEIEQRLPAQLKPEEATRADALGAEIAWPIIRELDVARGRRRSKKPGPDDPIIDGNAEKILPGVARDLPWPVRSGRPSTEPEVKTK